MNDLYKDILTGAVFVTGLIGFISGDFIISSTLFATAAVASNVNTNRKRGKVGHLSWDRCTFLTFLTQKWLEDFQGLTALEVFCFYVFRCKTRLKILARNQSCRLWRNSTPSSISPLLQILSMLYELTTCCSFASTRRVILLDWLI